MDTESTASYFASRFTYDPRRTGVWREIVRFVMHDMSSTESVLELGPGYGDFINQIDAGRKYAVDLNAATRELLATDINFVHGDCTDLSFLSAGAIQNIFASNLLEHLDRKQLRRLMSEILRVLAPCGRLLLIQPNYRLCSANYFDDYTHVTAFSDVSLMGFLKASGLKVVKVIPGLLPFSIESRAPKHPLLVRLYLNSPIRPFAKQMYVVAEKQGESCGEI